jgi:hypothetical protein
MIPPAPNLEVCGFCHGERRRETREKVAVVLAIGHTLRAHEALGCPDTLLGLLETLSSSATSEVYGRAPSSDHPITSAGECSRR